MRFADDPAGHIVALGFAPGGEIVIVDAIDGARFFERDPIRVRLLVPEVCSAPHFAEDGSFVAAGPRFIGRWDARTGKSLGRADLGGKISALHVSRDARRAAVTTYETLGLCYIPHEDIVVWDLETYRELARVRGEPDDSAPDPASALSPDGAALATNRDEDIVLLEVPSLRELGRWLGRGGEPFYFDRAGRLQVGPGSLDGAMDWRHIAEAISADSHTVVFADRDGRVMMDRR